MDQNVILLKTHYLLTAGTNSSENEAVALKILKFSCTKHEGNRVHFVKQDGIEKSLKTAEVYNGMHGLFFVFQYSCRYTNNKIVHKIHPNPQKHSSM